MPVTFYLKKGEEKQVNAACDTLIIEPDLRRFMLIWRAALPLRRNMFEVAQVVAGRMSPAWYRARATGKTWYPSLKELVDQRRADRAEAEQVSSGEQETEA